MKNTILIFSLFLFITTCAQSDGYERLLYLKDFQKQILNIPLDLHFLYLILQIILLLF